MNQLQVSRFETINPLLSDDSEKPKADAQLFAAVMDAARSHADDMASKALANQESHALPPREQPALVMEGMGQSSTGESTLEESSLGQDAGLGGGLPMRKELTVEEELRLNWLQNQLQQCLLSLAENPSEQTRQRIRELEKEISELTGMSMKSSLSKTAKNLTEVDKDAEDEEEQRGKKMPGEMAKELGANPLPIDRMETGVDKGDPNIMNFYQQNLAAFLAVGEQTSGGAVPNHGSLFNTKA